MPVSFECTKSKRKIFLENLEAVVRGNFKEILDALKSKDIKLIYGSTRSLLIDFYRIFALLKPEDRFEWDGDFDTEEAELTGHEPKIPKSAEAQARFHAQIQDKWPQPKSALNPGNPSRDEAFFRGYYPNSCD